MNVATFWTKKTTELLGQLGDIGSAWRQAAKLYPDAATLMRASGATQQKVAQFCNARVFGKGARMDAEKRRQLHEKIGKEMESRHCDYSTAFNRLYPQFANGDSFPEAQSHVGADGIPVLGPQLKALFRLPADTTPEEWKLIWTVNSERTSPIQFAKIFDALCEEMQKSGGSYEDALRDTKARFPALWNMVQELAKASF